MYSASKFEPWLYWPASVAVCVFWSSLSTSPREAAVGETYVPPPVIWQQWSSNSVTSGEPAIRDHVVLPLEVRARGRA